MALNSSGNAKKVDSSLEISLILFIEGMGVKGVRCCSSCPGWRGGGGGGGVGGCSVLVMSSTNLRRRWHSWLVVVVVRSGWRLELLSISPSLPPSLPYCHHWSNDYRNVKLQIIEANYLGQKLPTLLIWISDSCQFQQFTTRKFSKKDINGDFVHNINDNALPGKINK